VGDRDAWAALRFGTPGGAAALWVMSAIAITGTALGGGPFGQGELAERLLSLQAFMAIVAITTLVLGSASSERDEAVRKREELLEVVSHELKNPLSSIQLAAEVLLGKLPAGDRLRDRALAVQRSADRMNDLIQSMLDLGAIERGALSVQLRSEDAGSIVEEVVELLRPLAAERSHTLAARLPESSPSVRCDRERVLQILANLVGNAIKYAPKPAAIEIAAVVEQGCVRFSVNDTGPGIPPDQLEHVFERYWQARPNGRRGSGLGLYICRGLVHAHQGQIWVDSTLDKGTTFHFTLRT
jgi:signal transduction histidine kinase